MKVAALPLIVSAALALGQRGALADNVDALQEDFQEGRKLEQEAVTRTLALLNDKYALRKAEMSQRVRAMYKLSRASWPRIWFEPEIRQSASRWLGAARRIIKRDIAELAMLKNEIAITERDDERLRLVGEQELPANTSPSLHWPLEGSDVARSFGDYTGPSRRVRLRRRGLLLKAEPGAAVLAPAAGRVRFIGTISGLGESLIIEHGPVSAPTAVSILGRLAKTQVALDDSVDAGQALASAATEELYLEHRIGTMSKSVPVDPVALLPSSSR